MLDHAVSHPAVAEGVTDGDKDENGDDDPRQPRARGPAAGQAVVLVAGNPLVSIVVRHFPLPARCVV